MTELKNRPATLRDVDYRYPRSSIDAVDDLTWLVEANTFTVVAGASGSGKSTQLRLLNGLVPHFSGGQFGGEVHIGGLNTRQLPTRDLSRYVGFVFQEPDGLSIGGRVDDEIAFGMEQMAVPAFEMRRNVEEAMTLLGIEQLRSRRVSTLSGGERQRVAIAAAMAMRPSLLVLDEPTSQLDPAGADEVIQAVQRLNEEQGVTVVLSEHRLERVLPHADLLRVLMPGEIAAEGDPRHVLSTRGSPFAPSLFRAAQHLGWEPLPLSVKEARTKSAGMSLRSVPGGSSAVTGHVVIEMRDGELRHEGRVVLSGIDIAVREGEIVALMGPNGSGKSTFLRGLTGVHGLSRGKALIRTRSVAEIPKNEIGRQIGYLPQRARVVLFSETVRNEIAFSVEHRRGDMGTIEELMVEFGLERLADRHPFDISVGEQERLALAATLAGNPPVLLLDEPTRGLDLPRKSALVQSLIRRSHSGQAMVIATHDVEFAAQIASRVVLLGGGEIVADGIPRSILDGSMVYGTQINKVFGAGLLTLDDLMTAAEIDILGDTGATSGGAGVAGGWT